MAARSRLGMLLPCFMTAAAFFAGTSPRTFFVGGGAVPQVTPGQLESGAGLGGGHFASLVNNITTEPSEPLPSTQAPAGAAVAVALIEYIIFSGREATIVHGGGGTVTVAVGDAFKIVASDPRIDGHHIVTYVDSATQFRFSTTVSGETLFGGKVHVYIDTALASAAKVDVVDPAHNHECPAGYYCDGGSILKCGGPRFFCPMGSIRPQAVFEGEPNGGSASAPYAFYTVGGKGPGTRTSQTICPVGSFCIRGERFDCPAGTYGEQKGENKPLCTGSCQSGYYCPAGSFRATQITCGHAEFYCPTGSALPRRALAGHYTWKSTKMSVNDRGDAGEWLDSNMYNDDPELILTQQSAAVCEPGYYCEKGVRMMCPGGTFGASYGLSTSGCDGPCEAGYYCPPASIRATQHRCGGPHVFCPQGSAVPNPVRSGYYTFSHYTTDSRCESGSCNIMPVPTNIHTDEHQCELGHYCVNGTRYNCPAGTFGGVWGLVNASCSGPCEEGYYCPAQSHLATQQECGGTAVFCPHGSGIPTSVSKGYYSSAAAPPPILRHVEVSTERWADWPKLIFPPTLRTRSENEKRVRNFVIVEDADPTQRTRSREIVCPVGNFCDQGARYLCPAGTFGDIRGISTPACSGRTPGGFFGPAGTENSTQYPCSDPGFYCPEGSGSPTPVPAGWYSTAEGLEIRTTRTSCDRNNASMFETCMQLVYPHDAMHFRMHGDYGLDEYRSGIRMCPPGSFCPGVAGDGHRWEIPPGRFGSSPGISDHLGAGTGECRPGFFCPAGSVTAMERRCGSPEIAATTHEIQVISTESIWTGTNRRGVGVTGSFAVKFDTTSRVVDPDTGVEVEWNQVQTSTHICEAPCFRRRVNGVESPPQAIAHDASATDMKYFLEMLPNIGTVAVSRTAVSIVDHTYMWSITFLSVLGDAPLLRATPYTRVPTPLDGSDATSVNAHAHQHTHAAVHNDMYALSGATVQVKEQTKGKASQLVPARGADVYCPPGSGNPTPVSLGYYTNLRNSITSQVEHKTVEGSGKHEPSGGRSGATDEMAYEQVQCEVGHWCRDGLRDACPRGRYGSSKGLRNEMCSGPCAPGYRCPHGSYLATQIECGDGLEEPSSVYCPRGLSEAAWKPTPVSQGYYTIGGNAVTNRTRSDQRICELGHYCMHGRKIRCPSGTFGGEHGLSGPECSGLCHGGYFCPQGSHLATQVECGSNFGTRAPCIAKQRDGESSLTQRTGERRCEDDHALTRDETSSQGTGYYSVHPHETEDYSGGHPRQYHYHTTLFHTSRVRNSGLASSVYCPNGTGIPLQVSAGYYTSGGNETHNRTRTTQLRAEPGYFAEEGRLYRCPPGRYGSSRGLTTEFCTGFCPKGYSCPWATRDPVPCPFNTYAQAGSMACAQCPNRPAHTVNPDTTCRTSRSCCQK